MAWWRLHDGLIDWKFSKLFSFENVYWEGGNFWGNPWKFGTIRDRIDS